MRPLRLEVEGFLGWRRRQALDLEGIELFALVGPTGAGKSSLIDAICFALYGTVPRLDDRRQVTPVIHQLALEARVRLDFVVGGERYTAARVVRRLDGGRAATREARLERDGEVLAGDADGVSRAVEEVLGLSFDHFVRAVVLPQGEFARLLHDAPRERDELLKELVGAGVYERVRQRASALAQRLEAEVRAAEARLAELVATPEAAAEAEARAALLEELAREAREAERRLEDLARGLEEARAAARAAEERAERLAAVRIPHQVAEVVSRLDRASEDLARARAVEEEVRARLEEARRRREELPEASALRADLEALAAAEERARGATEAEAEADRRREERAAAEEAVGMARTRAEAARAKASEAEERLRALRERLGALPTPDRLRGDLDALAQVEARREAVAGAERGREEAEAARRAEEERLAAAEAEEARAREEREHLRLVHAALEVASGLEPGDPCPVCGRPLEGPVSRARPDELAAAEERYRSAADALAGCRLAAERARERLAAAQAALQAARDELERAQKRARGLPSREELERQLGEVEEIRRAEEEADRAWNEARQVREEAEVALRAAEEAERGCWEAFRVAHESVADCGPPAPPRELAAAWDELARWAAERAAGERRTAEEALRRAGELEVEARRLKGDLAARLEACGVPRAGDEPASAAAVRAAEAARMEAERLRGELAEAERLQAELAAREEERQVALALERELRSDRFPRWLLEEALGELVEGASERLRELSRGRYSLDLDRGTRDVRFVVVDHAHADQRRPVRTLSGGETFLASLALALALGSHVAGLAARPGALETLFLDEGFGTLDPESLDVVATALEELAAGDRLVGVVTHLRELAERIPVRFEVRPGPDGPTLQRVEG